jgi:hypothetical protein
VTAVRPTRVAGALLLVLVACGSNGDKTTAGDHEGSPRLSTTTSTATSTSQAAGSTTPVSVAATHPTTHLVAVRAARQEGSDRVVFEFSERAPGYRVAYAPKPIMGTSGKEIPLAGNAALVVRMEAASGVDLSSGFRQTYVGPNRLQPAGTRQLEEVAQVEDFEGVLVWALGLKGQAPFRVDTLESPPRLVIDVVG